MDTPTRRTLLTGTAGTVALLTAGCLDAGTSGDDIGSGSEDGPNDGSSDDGNATSDERITEDPRVDEPPYEIVPPESPDGDADEWNDHYLGERMATEPTLEFEAIHGVRLEEPLLTEEFTNGAPSEETGVNETSDDEDGRDDRPDQDDTVTDPAEEPPTDTPSDSDPEIAPVDGEYAVHLLADDGDLSDLVYDHVGEEGRAVLEAVDFDEQVVVLVESGWGSSSIRHQWVRVEAGDTDDALELHGYYTDPQVRTHDYTTRHSAVVVDRTADQDLAFARIRLTVSEDHRVNVNSTEGVVSLERE